LASVHAHYCDRYVMVAAKFRRLISPVLVLGYNFLMSGHGDPSVCHVSQP